jgi:hypothetical protein
VSQLDAVPDGTPVCSCALPALTCRAFLCRRFAAGALSRSTFSLRLELRHKIPPGLEPFDPLLGPLFPALKALGYAGSPLRGWILLCFVPPGCAKTSSHAHTEALGLNSVVPPGLDFSDISLHGLRRFPRGDKARYKLSRSRPRPHGVGCPAAHVSKSARREAPASSLLTSKPGGRHGASSAVSLKPTALVTATRGESRGFPGVGPGLRPGQEGAGLWSEENRLPSFARLGRVRDPSLH